MCVYDCLQFNLLSKDLDSVLISSVAKEEEFREFRHLNKWCDCFLQKYSIKRKHDNNSNVLALIPKKKEYKK